MLSDLKKVEPKSYSPSIDFFHNQNQLPWHKQLQINKSKIEAIEVFDILKSVLAQLEFFVFKLTGLPKKFLLIKSISICRKMNYFIHW